MHPMDKFRSDVDQTLRRASGRGEKAVEESLRTLFLRSFTRCGEETSSALFASYLERRRSSPEAALSWLCAIGSILLMDYDGTPLERGDWEELRDAIGLDADSLDMELVTYAMSLVLDHGAL